MGPRKGDRTETIPRAPLERRIAATLLAQILRDAGDQFLRGVLRRPPRRPWMKHREIAALSALLCALRPRRALEWGAGYGTLYFPRLLPTGARWTAVEDDAVWAGIVRRRGPDPHVEIVHVAPNRAWTGGHGDAAYEDFRDYVDAAAAYAPLDFILVDGRARRACLRKARDWLAPRGWVALHDANREVYRDSLALYPHRLLLSDRRTGGGGLFLGSLDTDPRDVIDADRERALWNAYARFGRWFRHL